MSREGDKGHEVGSVSPREFIGFHRRVRRV